MSQDRSLPPILCTSLILVLQCRCCRGGSLLGLVLANSSHRLITRHGLISLLSRLQQAHGDQQAPL